MNNKLDHTETIKINKILIEKYPFLQIDENYYDSTYLDDVPQGWTELFINMCEEIKSQLIEEDRFEDFKIIQTKEKFGELRVYNNGSRKINDIIDKYSVLSSKTCCNCGAPATKISKGWICPWCDSCADEEVVHDKFIAINEWFKEWNDD